MITFPPIIVQDGTGQGHNEYRNIGAAGDRILPVSICTLELRLSYTHLHLNLTRRELVSSGMLTHLRSQTHRLSVPQDRQAQIRDSKTNTRDNMMETGKEKEHTIRNQDYLALSEPDSPSTASVGHPQYTRKARHGFKNHISWWWEKTLRT